MTVYKIIYYRDSILSNNEFEAILNADSYLVPRKKPDEFDTQMFLKEVDFICPLCGKELRHNKQKKKDKLLQIAHIYPNRPTKQQYEALKGLERMGENCESFKNRIALCKDCHGTQDYNTTKEDYLILLNKKKRLLELTELREATFTLGLESEISIIVEKMTHIKEEDLAELLYTPVPIINKFLPNESLLKQEIAYYVTLFYPMIFDTFKSLEGKNNFTFETLARQIKTCFIKMNKISTNKEYIFDQIVNWIKHKTCSNSARPCKAVVAFFVQNCEVFYEITK